MVHEDYWTKVINQGAGTHCCQSISALRQQVKIVGVDDDFDKTSVVECQVKFPYV